MEVCTTYEKMEKKVQILDNKQKTVNVLEVEEQKPAKVINIKTTKKINDVTLQKQYILLGVPK